MTETRHETLTFNRSLGHAPAAVFEAFASPEARGIWSPPSPEFNMAFTETDFRVGGRDLCVCGEGPAEGVTVETVYHAIETNTQIVLTEAIGMPGAPEAVGLVTITMAAGQSGTDLTVTVQLADLSGGAMISEVGGGWTSSLANLDAYLGGQTTG